MIPSTTGTLTPTTPPTTVGPANDLVALLDVRSALDALLAQIPPSLPAINSLLRQRVPAVRVEVVPLETLSTSAFLSPPSPDPVVLVVAPQQDGVQLGLDLRLPGDLHASALLHGLGHILLGHVRPGDAHGHRDTLACLRGLEPLRRWDRQVRAAFAPWFAPVQAKTAEPTMSALERLRFALVRDGPRLPGGHLVGISTAPIAPWPHQEVVARRLVESWPYSFLLCDEVGLGKTIESGLALRALLLSGTIRRVLIAAPASLAPQWQRELADKFFLSFGLAQTGSGRWHRYLFPAERAVSSTSLYAPELAIVSTGLVTRAERQHDLRTAPKFDIVLLDEAHYARRENSNRGTAVEPRYGQLYVTMRDILRPKAECLWLATATPMQIDAIEVADLVQLTNRAGAFQFAPDLLLSYYDLLGKLVRGTEVTAEDWEFLRQAVKSVEHQDPLLWRFLKPTILDDGKIRLAARKWLEEGKVPRGKDRTHMLRLIFAAAPLSRVMLRHTRRLLEIYRQHGKLGANLARREILPVPRIVFTDQERRAYDQLDDYCHGLAQQVAAHASAQTHAAVGFLLSFLRLRFASSLFAIKETLRRRRERVLATLAAHQVEAGDALELEAFVAGDDDGGDDEAVAALLHDRSPEDLAWEKQQLDQMLQTLGDLSGLPSKLEAFLRALEQRRLSDQPGRLKQLVVFTRFYDTLTDLVRRLHILQPNLRLGTYSGAGGQWFDPERGQVVTVDRDEVKHRFLRGEIDLLLCTDAAAEGLNLQMADLLINYDLPWNPMKVEQRIGRIDRIGQRYESVQVLNLCYVDSAEQIVYDRLLRRLEATEGVVGAQQIALLPVTLEEFAQLADRSLSEEELEQRARQRLRDFQQRAAAMEMRPEDLYEIYQRLSERGQQTPPVDLAAIWQTLRESTWLRERGCSMRETPDGPLLTLAGIAGVSEGTCLTATRTLFEKGLPEMEGRLRFASYGDPAFEAVLAQVESIPLPACVRRLSAVVEGHPAERIGFAVALRGEGGLRSVQLVTNWRQLDLDLDEATELSEAEVAPLRAVLVEQLRQEVQPRQVRRLEQANLRAGRAQQILEHLVMASLVDCRRPHVQDGDLFWEVLKDLGQMIAERERLIAPDVPAAHLRAIHQNLLFECVVPESDDRGRLTAPRVLLQAALAAASRLAESLRERRAELQTERMLQRLRREIERLLKELPGGAT